MNELRATLSRLIASVFYVGYIPVAPGTFGSLAAMAVVWLLRPEESVLALIWLCVLLLGLWSAGRAEEAFNAKDSQRIVIDEFAGYITALLFLPLTPGIMIAALVLFRILDITKPPPIRNLERSLKGGVGVMMDDIAAGLIANLIIRAGRLI